MDTITTKAKLIGLGVVNDAFDFAITNWLDLTVLRQKARELEKVIRRVNFINDGVNAQIADLEKYLRDARRHAKNLDVDITTILADGDEGNDGDAVVLQAELSPLQAEIEKRDRRLKEARVNRDSNNEMLEFLQVRLTEIVTKIGELEEAKAETKTLNAAAAAVEATNDVLDNTASLDDIGAQIMAKNGQARQHYARVVGSVQAKSGQDTTMAAARAEIARRKAALQSA